MNMDKICPTVQMLARHADTYTVRQNSKNHFFIWKFIKIEFFIATTLSCLWSIYQKQNNICLADWIFQYSPTSVTVSVALYLGLLGFFYINECNITLCGWQYEMQLWIMNFCIVFLSQVLIKQYCLWEIFPSLVLFLQVWQISIASYIMFVPASVFEVMKWSSTLNKKISNLEVIRTILKQHMLVMKAVIMCRGIGISTPNSNIDLESAWEFLFTCFVCARTNMFVIKILVPWNQPTSL
jgi:hypothetical protein